MTNTQRFHPQAAQTGLPPRPILFALALPQSLPHFDFTRHGQSAFSRLCVMYSAYLPLQVHSPEPHIRIARVDSGPMVSASPALPGCPPSSDLSGGPEPDSVGVTPRTAPYYTPASIANGNACWRICVASDLASTSSQRSHKMSSRSPGSCFEIEASPLPSVRTDCGRGVVLPAKTV